jgi:hypothetical protein
MNLDELPRFNMPYELGLDIGCWEYGSRRYKDKRTLILETERYHYQKVISDIAGQDIEDHEDDPKTLIRKVRNWFSTIDGATVYPSASTIWNAYREFCDDITITFFSKGFTANEIEDVLVSDFIKSAKDWIKNLKS